MTNHRSARSRTSYRPPTAAAGSRPVRRSAARWVPTGSRSRLNIQTYLLQPRLKGGDVCDHEARSHVAVDVRPHDVRSAVAQALLNELELSDALVLALRHFGAVHAPSEVDVSFSHFGFSFRSTR